MYLHRGFILLAYRGAGVGSALPRWAEEHIHGLASEHSTADRAMFCPNAAADDADGTALLLAAGYRPVVSIVEVELPDRPGVRRRCRPGVLARGLGRRDRRPLGRCREVRTFDLLTP